MRHTQSSRTHHGQQEEEDGLFIRIFRVIIMLSCLILIVLGLAAMLLLFLAFGRLSDTNIIENVWLLGQAFVGFYAGLYKTRPALILFAGLCALHAILVSLMVTVGSGAGDLSGKQLRVSSAELATASSRPIALTCHEQVAPSAAAAAAAAATASASTFTSIYGSPIPENYYRQSLITYAQNITNNNSTSYSAPESPPLAQSSVLECNHRANRLTANRLGIEVPSDEAKYIGMFFQWSIVTVDITLAVMAVLMALVTKGRGHHHHHSVTAAEELASQQITPTPQAQQQGAPPPSRGRQVVGVSNRQQSSRHKPSARKSPASPPASRLPNLTPAVHKSHRSQSKRSQHRLNRSLSPPQPDSRRYRPQPVVLMNQMAPLPSQQAAGHKSIESNQIPKAITRTGSLQLERSP